MARICGAVIFLDREILSKSIGNLMDACAQAPTNSRIKYWMWRIQYVMDYSRFKIL